MTGDEPIEVDIIVPIHNSSKTLAATLDSALGQRSIQGYPDIVIYICCYDDASTDASLNILEDYDKRYSDKLKSQGEEGSIETHILFSKSADGVSRGAGYARNCAISLRACSTAEYCFLCMLDSDDEMHSNRVAEQVSFLMKLPSDERDRALLGTQFVRDPIDVHYSNWANNLSDERLYLERFREVTLIQPTWMISRQRFCSMGFYMEAPRVDNDTPFEKFVVQEQLRFPSLLRIIHPTAETPATLRLAEDLRFFYTHLQANGTLHLLRCGNMVVYKQASTTSQSSQTSRKLLLQIRVFAFEQCILKDSPHWQYHGKRFVVWNAGRDGKNFVKGLSKEMRNRVYCLVDVDEKKIEQGYYVNRDIGVKIPIVHFSFLVKDNEVRERLQQSWMEGGDENDPGFGPIDKAKPKESTGKLDNVESLDPPTKKQRKRRLYALKDSEIDLSILQELPVVVCVAMNRTNGALENNVATIGRIEGKDLWHLI